MQRLTYMVFITTTEKTVPADGSRACCLLNSRFRLCTSLAPRPMTVVFGLGTKICVRMHTKLQNVACNIKYRGQYDKQSGLRVKMASYATDTAASESVM